MNDEVIQINRYFEEYGYHFYGRWKGGRKREKNIKIFEKLLSEIRRYERKYNVQVDIEKYIQAHYKIYGRNLYPSQLLSKHSVSIYRDFMSYQNFPVACPVDLDHRKEEIKYLANIWNLPYEKAFQIFE